MELTDLVQFGFLFLTLIGLFVTINYSRKQLGLFNEQLRLNFFVEYTKRYQEIMLNLPEDINNPDFSFKKLSKEERSKILRYMRAYFDLCSEEFDLWNAGYIDERIWNNWKEGIEFTFSKSSFKEAWSIIQLDSLYYPKFTSWIEEILSKQKDIATQENKKDKT